MEMRNWLRAIRRCFNGTRKKRVLWFYGLATITSIVMFIIFWCTSVFRDAILSNLQIRNGTASYLMWQRPPVGVVLRVYVFNYTNLEAFESGDANKLQVQQVGPLVYRETLNRVNARLHENGTITYQEKRSYKWISGEFENQTVIVPNVLLMSVMAYSRNLSYFLQLLFTTVLSSLHSKPFLTLPIGEYLWGYEDQLFRAIKPFASFRHHVPFDKFGILVMRNGLNEDRITMHTGINDMRNIGVIEQVNGMHDRKIWGDKKCDTVYGTDGSMFPPHWIDQPQDSELRVYVKDFCRQLPFRYERRDYFNDIPTFRYNIPSDIFSSANDENSCFCSKESANSVSRKCPPMGTFNVSACKFNTPMIVSFPHFYSANESLFQDIDGLTPLQEHSESYIHLHQKFGITVSARTKMQLNVEVRKSSGVPFAENLKDGIILPLIWTDSEVENLPESIQRLLYHGHYLVNALEAGFQWCSLIGVILSFGSFIIAFNRDKHVDEKLNGKLNGKLNSPGDHQLVVRRDVAAT